MNTRSRLLLGSIWLILSLTLACGGGASSDSSGGNFPPPMVITDSYILPGTLTDEPYSVTLHAQGGHGTLHWSIAPLSPTTLFVEGLSIDPSSGVLSGTANWYGTAGFAATVSDSSSPPLTASKGFTISASSPLVVTPTQNVSVGQFDSPIISVGTTGGVYPFYYKISGGALPPGLHLDSLGRIVGTPYTAGTYHCQITVRDSYTPPEVGAQLITFTVQAPRLSVANSLPTQLFLNRPFSGAVIATGGTPPYSFALSDGALPTGMGPLDANTGQVSGTPSVAGGYGFAVTVTDSSPTPQSAEGFFGITVTTPIGRNDTPATATLIDNGYFSASISPYVDPPDGPPVPGDGDYYKVTSLSNAIVHVETQARVYNPYSPLDTVLEIVDANGNRYSNCRLPGNNGNIFNSACINDDISSNPLNQDSALDFRVPGSPNTPTMFCIHVLDWRGDARPDMIYQLVVSGVVDPLQIQTKTLLPAARGLAYSQDLSAINGIGTVSWTITQGTLPPGLTLNSAGRISGTATTNGSYDFTVKAKDSGNPPQITTAPETIVVVDPVRITTSPNFPDACVNQPYSFTVQSSGGAPPIYWTFYSSYWISINLDQLTGTFSGTTDVTGTFHGRLGVIDQSGSTDSQDVTLTVKQCP